MDEINVEKWWNEICGRGKQEKPIVSYCWASNVTINPQNLIKIVGTIFEKMEILIYFLM